LGKIYNALEKSKGNIPEVSEPKLSEPNVPEPKIPGSKVSDRDNIDTHENTTVSENTSSGNFQNARVKSSINPSSEITEGVIPNNIDPNIVTAFKPYSVESEQFRQLKNSILFPDKRTPPRTIMVTSTAPNEGKSFVSANLSTIIAQSIDEHVLLIDCDLRKPSIHKMFGFGETDGLSQYLLNEKPLIPLLLKTYLSKLTILPGGHIPPNPSELLSSEQMRRLIHEVKMRYSDRYIIIDTPPPYLTSETNAIARHVDGIILVVKKGVANFKDLQGLKLFRHNKFQYKSIISWF